MQLSRLSRQHPLLRRQASLTDVALVCATSLAIMGAAVGIPVAAVWLWTRYPSARARACLVLGLVFLVFGPAGIQSPYLRVYGILGLWRSIERYFSVSVVNDGGQPIPPRSIIALTPHGIVPINAILGVGGSLMSRMLSNARPVTASVVLRLPVLRHFLAMFGGLAASPSQMRAALDEGSNLLLLPGGVKGIFYARGGTGGTAVESVAIRDRKGFVRVALQTGASIVPVHAFGNSDMMQFAPISSLLAPVLENLSRFLRASVLLFYGRFGLPIPFQLPMLFAIGQAIPVPRVANPPQELVDRIHAQYVDAIRGLFEKYKVAYGWGDRTLAIV